MYHASIHDTSIISDENQIRAVAEKVIAAHPKAVSDYKSGKQQTLFFLIGQVKKQLREVDVALTQKIVRDIIA